MNPPGKKTISFLVNESEIGEETGKTIKPQMKRVFDATWDKLDAETQAQLAAEFKHEIAVTLVVLR